MEWLVSRRKPALLGTTLSCERKMVTLESVGNWVGADTEAGKVEDRRNPPVLIGGVLI